MGFFYLINTSKQMVGQLKVLGECVEHKQIASNGKS